MSRFILSIAMLLCVCTQLLSQQVSIIPEPVSLRMGQGSYTLNALSAISVPARQAEIQRIARYFADKVKTLTGLSLNVAEGGNGNIRMELNSTADARLGREGYTLEVSPNGMAVKANQPAGLFYGVQTLLQLLPAKQSTSSAQVPSLTVVDYPRFGYRGVMLDVSRHFFPKEYVKNYIDQLAQYKFNRFHWHLTDDNGWRLEIKSLPRLTQVGAWRVPRVGAFGTVEAPKPGEKATDGGFYTQEDVREIVQYAKDRFIEILPEVDVPGHSMAAVAAYPELSVTKDTTIKVNPGSNFSTWHGNGKFTMHIDNTLNPTDEKVYSFLDKVFTEIAALFPYEYIHIGGDECYKGFWERDPNVQAFMTKNNIKSGEELQSYFTKRVVKIVTSKKKKAIGWDEILEGGLAPGAAVMSWRGTKGGIEAAHQKHEVVMSPAPTYYLDMNQGEASIEPPIYNTSRLRDVYSHEVLPEGVDSVYILGGQGNLWTEQIPTTAQVEYMTYPRAFAMAESFWSPKSKKNFNSFVDKVEKQFERFDQINVNYATSMYDPIIKITKKKDGDQITITMDKEVDDITIHYTYDNTIPNRYSTAYSEPVVLPAGANSFRVMTFRNGKPLGRLISFKREDLVKKARAE